MSLRREWLSEPLPANVRLALERLEREPDVAHIVVLPDVHLAREVCVGTVVATHQTLYPAAVGGDIGCGMAAIQLGSTAEVLADERSAARVLAGFEARVPILRHPRRDAVEALPSALTATSLSDSALDGERRRNAARQLGTLGRGNHFIEVQADEEERLWLMVHTGSRGMGQVIREHHERRAGQGAGGLVRIEAESDAGRDYLHDLAWALDYAAVNRDRLLSAAAAVLADELGAEAREETRVSCHHNFVACECHAGERLWVHRKGAIRAQRGEPGLVPGSMGAPSYHVEGRGESASLCSSAHGAGRQLARGAARARISRRDVERQLRGVWYDGRLLDALRDEAPSAYKDIDAVLRAQRDLTRVVRRLRPVLGFKGG